MNKHFYLRVVKRFQFMLLVCLMLGLQTKYAQAAPPPTQSNETMRLSVNAYVGETITISLVGSGTIYWGDGDSSDNNSIAQHVYTINGPHTVDVKGTFTEFHGVTGDYGYNNLISLVQWGNLGLVDITMGCRSSILVSMPDSIPSTATNISYLVSLATNFNDSNVLQWDLSNVTKMNWLFQDCSSFNQPINNWNVSNVTEMKGTFFGCANFNQPLNDWNVSNVVEMNQLFEKCFAFNQNINNWNVSNVTMMQGLFTSCTIYNQPLNNWDVSKVTHMAQMFLEAYAFNQPIGNWNVSSVTNMSQMFQEAHSFNQPIGNWNVSNVTSLVATFIAAYSFNQNINNWNVSNVNDMYGTFAYCNEFNQPLNNWNVSNVTNMFGTFYSAGKFNQPLNNWNVSNVTSMDGMFYMEDTITNAAFNQDLSNWCVTQIAQEPQVFRYNAVNFTNTTLQPNWGNCGQPCNKPTDVNVTVNSATSATISWNAQNNATGYFVQLRVKGALGNWGGATSSTNSYSFNALQPNTIYEYRVRSVCSTQTPANGAFTLIGEFTTPVYVAPLPYCNAPTNINATVTGANSVTLTWTASEGAQQYFVQFKPSTSSWANSFGSTAYSTTKTFTNLVPNTTYDYRVRTTCVTGQTMNPGSTFSSINNFTTLPGDLSALFNLNESAWSIYPNPTHDLVQLEFTSSVEEALTIMVFDMTGRLVQSVVTQSLKGNNQIDISLGTLSNGMYIIKSRQGDAVTTLGKVTKN